MASVKEASFSLRKSFPLVTAAAAGLASSGKIVTLRGFATGAVKTIVEIIQFDGPQIVHRHLLACICIRIIAVCTLSFFYRRRLV
jgi:hypothetical protein